MITSTCLSFQIYHFLRHQPHPKNQLEWIGVHMNLGFISKDENSQYHIRLWFENFQFEFSCPFVGQFFAHTFIWEKMMKVDH
jgi:hypothetical protein